MESRGRGLGSDDTKLELFAAASNKDVKLCQQLIEKKADVNRKGPVRDALPSLAHGSPLIQA